MQSVLIMPSLRISTMRAHESSASRLAGLCAPSGHNRCRCHAQVQRLIAVLSCRGVRKASLADGAALSEGAAAAKLSDDDLTALRGAGWRPGMTLRELLNYAGEPPPCVYLSSWRADGSTSPCCNQAGVVRVWAVIPRHA